MTIWSTPPLLTNHCAIPRFSIKPFHQSPQNRCFIAHRKAYDVGVSNTLSYRVDIPNSVFETYLLFARSGIHFYIFNLEQGPDSILIFPRDADTIIFAFHALNSFFERYSSITFQLYKKPADAKLLQARKPCYIPIQDLPWLKSIRYLNASTNLDANDIEECNLKLWTTVTALAPNLYEIKFPSGKLVPFAPINARNDRVYYKRERTNVYHHAEPFYWFVLRIQTGDPLPQLWRSFWLIHWAHTHILDHKHLFALLSLQAQHTTIGYTRNGGTDYNNTFTLPPTEVTFPAQVVKNPAHNHWWNFRLHDQCNKRYLHHHIFPYGNLEVELLNIRPPTRTQELCQQLPDPDKPFKSYIRLQNFIQNSTAKNYAWFSWPTRYTNTTQPSINFQQFTSKFSNDTLESDYQAFTTPFTYYFQSCRKHEWMRRSPPLKSIFYNITFLIRLTQF